MKANLFFVLVLLFISSFTIIDSPCRKIRIIPFQGKNGKVDRFKLMPIVKQRFQKLGFQVIDKDSSLTSLDNCQILECRMVHTENYWEYKKDTVTLIIKDSSGRSIAQYQGVVGPVVMTFKSGFTDATVAALNLVNPKDF